jgi:hypothetical protein
MTRARMRRTARSFLSVLLRAVTGFDTGAMAGGAAEAGMPCRTSWVTCVRWNMQVFTERTNEAQSMGFRSMSLAPRRIACIESDMSAWPLMNMSDGRKPESFCSLSANPRPSR